MWLEEKKKTWNQPKKWLGEIIEKSLWACGMLDHQKKNVGREDGKTTGLLTGGEEGKGKVRKNKSGGVLWKRASDYMQKEKL